MHYIKDSYKRRLDLYFDKIPSDEVRLFLKNEGWHWNKSKHCWFAYLSQDNINTAEALGAVRLEPQDNTQSTPKPQNLTCSFGGTPILNKLYSTPTTAENIRQRPASTEELKSGGLSSSVIFEYLKLTYCLYTEIMKDRKQLAVVTLLLTQLINFCKNNGLIHRLYDANVNMDSITVYSSESFEDFRLAIEWILAETDPAVQFMKCVYDVDVKDFEDWRNGWDPTMCKLGHVSQQNSGFLQLSYNQLLALQEQIYRDAKSNRYEDFFDKIFYVDYWQQIIIWNLEDYETQGVIASDDDSTLYIHKGRIVCQTNHHNVIQATAILSNGLGLDIELNVNHCTRCKKFFMSYSTYQHYRNKYGIILGDLKMLKREDFTECGDLLAEESPLHLCGYNVAEKAGLSTVERQNIIAFVIRSGVMEKSQVISHLNWLIDTNKARANMGAAVGKWDEDLSYALQYDMDNQTRHKINRLMRYHPNQFKL